MEVTFDDLRLQKLVESREKLVSKFGPASAKKLAVRLAALRAVETVADLRHLPGAWHELTADFAGMWAADVGHPRRLLIRASPPVPMKRDGGVHWAEVRRVSIVGIVDYH